MKPLNHSHDLPPPGKKGRTYICSCFIYLRPTAGAKLLMNKWIEELQDQPWSRAKKANDQPAFNWALNKTAGQVHIRSLLELQFCFLHSGDAQWRFLFLLIKPLTVIWLLVRSLSTI